MHLGELELSLGANSLRKRSIANDVSKCLTVAQSLSVSCMRGMRVSASRRRIPFGLVLRVDLPLSVVTNVANLRETSNVEFGSAELRHDGVEQDAVSPLAECRWTDDEMRFCGNSAT